MFLSRVFSLIEGQHLKESAKNLFNMKAEAITGFDKVSNIQEVKKSLEP
jgi:hypothetical protein